MSERSVLGEALAAAFPGIDESLLPPVTLPQRVRAMLFCEGCGKYPYDLLYRERLLCAECITIKEAVR